MRERARWVMGLALLGLWLPTVVRADVPSPGETTSSPASRNWLDASVALGWSEGSETMGLTLQGALGYRAGLLHVGLAGQLATALFHHRASPYVLAGLALPIGRFRLGLDANLGLNLYANAGGLLSERPATSAMLPFAGGTATLLLRLNERPVRYQGWLGVSAGYAEDLGRVVRQVTYSDTSWFSGEPYTRSDEVVFGAGYFTLLLVCAISVPGY